MLLFVVSLLLIVAAVAVVAVAVGAVVLRREAEEGGRASPPAVSGETVVLRREPISAGPGPCACSPGPGSGADPSPGPDPCVESSPSACLSAAALASSSARSTASRCCFFSRFRAFLSAKSMAAAVVRERVEKMSQMVCVRGYDPGGLCSGCCCRSTREWFYQAIKLKRKLSIYRAR